MQSILNTSTNKVAHVRIGPRMQQLLDLVRANPGNYCVWYAERVGPHGSRHYGYRTLYRAEAAGLIEYRPGHRKYTHTVWLREAK